MGSDYKGRACLTPYSALPAKLEQNIKVGHGSTQHAERTSRNLRYPREAVDPHLVRSFECWSDEGL